MAPSRPELIFVAGPQQGQRGLLASNMILLGRSTSCDVRIEEQAVSREQARIELTIDGWVVQNISSSNPLRINGKKYKPKTQVILETGDVLGLGLRTELLFVSPGDDSEAAIGDYRLANPVQIRDEHKPAAANDESAGQGGQSEAASAEDIPAAPAAPITPEPTQLANDEVDEKELARKAKVRKYIIFGGIYVVLLIVGIIVLSVKLNLNAPDETKIRKDQDRVFLRDDEIADAIKAPLTGVDFYPSEAVRALQKAKEYYEGEIDNTGDLYRSVKFFKLYLAYKGSTDFADTSNEKMFITAKLALIDRVSKRYREACIHEHQDDWVTALRLFEEVQKMLPVNEDPRVEGNHAVLKNILGHITYVRKRYLAIKRR